MRASSPKILSYAKKKSDFLDQQGFQYQTQQPYIIQPDNKNKGDASPIKDTLQLREKNLMQKILHLGLQNPDVWRESKELAIKNYKVGINFLKENKLEEAEIYLKKAKQLTEPLSPLCKWEEREDWNVLRLTLYRGLLRLFLSQKKQKKAFDLLYKPLSEFNQELLFRNAVIAELDSEPVFLTVAEISYSLEKFEEASNLARSIFSSVDYALRNQLLITDLHRVNREKNKVFSMKQKYLSKAQAIFLLAKIQLRTQKGKEDEALIAIKEACQLQAEYAQTQEELTVLDVYEKKKGKLMRHLDFKNNIMDTSFDVDLRKAKLNTLEKVPGSIQATEIFKDEKEEDKDSMASCKDIQINNTSLSEIPFIKLSKGGGTAVRPRTATVRPESDNKKRNDFLIKPVFRPLNTSAKGKAKANDENSLGSEANNDSNGGIAKYNKPGRKLIVGGSSPNKDSSEKEEHGYLKNYFIKSDSKRMPNTSNLFYFNATMSTATMSGQKKVTNISGNTSKGDMSGNQDANNKSLGILEEEETKTVRDRPISAKISSQDAYFLNNTRSTTKSIMTTKAMSAFLSKTQPLLRKNFGSDIKQKPPKPENFKKYKDLLHSIHFGKKEEKGPTKCDIGGGSQINQLKIDMIFLERPKIKDKGSPEPKEEIITSPEPKPKRDLKKEFKKNLAMISTESADKDKKPKKEKGGVFDFNVSIGSGLDDNEKDASIILDRKFSEEPLLSSKKIPLGSAQKIKIISPNRNEKDIHFQYSNSPNDGSPKNISQIKEGSELLKVPEKEKMSVSKPVVRSNKRIPTNLRKAETLALTQDSRLSPSKLDPGFIRGNEKGEGRSPFKKTSVFLNKSPSMPNQTKKDQSQQKKIEFNRLKSKKGWQKVKLNQNGQWLYDFSSNEELDYCPKSERYNSEPSDDYSNLSDFLGPGQDTVGSRKKMARKLMTKKSLPILTIPRKKGRKSFLVDSIAKNISSLEFLRQSHTKSIQIYFHKKGMKLAKKDSLTNSKKYNPYFRRDKRENSIIKLETVAKKARAAILIQRFLKRILVKIKGKEERKGSTLGLQKIIQMSSSKFKLPLAASPFASLKRESEHGISQESAPQDYTRRHRKPTVTISKENFADAVEDVRRNSFIETSEALNPDLLHHVEFSFQFQFIKIIPLKWRIERCEINQQSKSGDEVLRIKIVNEIGTLEIKMGYEKECLHERKGHESLFIWKYAIQIIETWIEENDLMEFWEIFEGELFEIGGLQIYIYPDTIKRNGKPLPEPITNLKDKVMASEEYIKGLAFRLAFLLKENFTLKKKLWGEVWSVRAGGDDYRAEIDQNKEEIQIRSKREKEKVRSHNCNSTGIRVNYLLTIGGEISEKQNLEESLGSINLQNMKKEEFNKMLIPISPVDKIVGISRVSSFKTRKGDDSANISPQGNQPKEINFSESLENFTRENYSRGLLSDNTSPVIALQKIQAQNSSRSPLSSGKSSKFNKDNLLRLQKVGASEIREIREENENDRYGDKIQGGMEIENQNLIKSIESDNQVSQPSEKNNHGSKVSSELHELQEDPYKINLTENQSPLEDKMEDIVTIYERFKRRSSTYANDGSENQKQKFFKVREEEHEDSHVVQNTSSEEKLSAKDVASESSDSDSSDETQRENYDKIPDEMTKPIGIPLINKSSLVRASEDRRSSVSMSIKNDTLITSRRSSLMKEPLVVRKALLERKLTSDSHRSSSPRSLKKSDFKPFPENDFIVSSEQHELSNIKKNGINEGFPKVLRAEEQGSNRSDKSEDIKNMSILNQYQEARSIKSRENSSIKKGEFIGEKGVFNKRFFKGYSPDGKRFTLEVTKDYFADRPKSFYQDPDEDNQFNLNVFDKNEILFAGIIKLEGVLILQVIRIIISKKKRNHKEEELPEYKFEVFLKSAFRKNGWNDKAKFEYKDFCKYFLEIDHLPQKLLLVRNGFSRRQKVLILKNSMKKFKIKNTKLDIGAVIDETKENISKNELFIEKILEQHKTFSKLGKILNMNISVGESLSEVSPAISLEFSILKARKRGGATKDEGSEHNIVSMVEPSVGSSLHIENMAKILTKKSLINIIGKGIKTLSFYNSVRRLSRKKYFLELNNKELGKIYIRISFESRVGSKEFVKISWYEPLQKQSRYCLVTNQRDIEKIINILQSESKMVQSLLMGMLLRLKISMVGKVLAVEEKRKDVALERVDQSMYSQLRISNLRPLKLALFSGAGEAFFHYYYTPRDLFEMYTIPYVGNCFIKIKFFKQNSHYSFDKNLYFVIEMRPFNSRTKLFKVVISYFDIRKHLSRSTLAVENEKKLIHQINEIVLNNLKYQKTFIHSSFTLPCYTASDAISNRDFQLVPDVKHTHYEEAHPKCFYKEKYIIFRTVYKGVKKLSHGQYVILIVQKHLRLNYWVITLYSPRSSRTFMTTMYNNDLLDLIPQVFDESYEISVNELNKILFKRGKCSYLNFLEVFEEFREDIMKKSSILGASSSKMFASIDHEQFMNNYWRPNAFSYNLYYETLFWTIILNESIIQPTIKQKFTLYIKKFKGILRELCTLDTLSLSRGENLQIEIFIEQEKISHFLTKAIDRMVFKKTQGFSLFMRITHLEKSFNSNHRYNFKDICYSYMIDGIKSHRFSKFPSLVAAEIDQGDFRHIGAYIMEKIRNNESLLKINDALLEEGNITVSHVKEMENKKKFLLISPHGFVNSLKLNTSMAYDQVLSTVESNYLLLYRNVFTVKPLQMISIIYSFKEKRFILHINNNKNSKTHIQKIKIDEAQLYIPYIKAMLELKLYSEVGSRLVKAYKNRLLISSYSLWKESQFLK